MLTPPGCFFAPSPEIDMEQHTQNPNVKADPSTKAKAEWRSPHYRSYEAKDAELGLGVGADLIILGTSS
jgi:hypothetical protein